MEVFMKYLVVKICISFVLVCSFSSVHAETVNEKSIKNLSPELRVLLQKEMNAIEAAMGEILIANASGDTKKIANLAGQIKDSFILKKNLTKSQRHELHTSLPNSFLKKDVEFHYNAGMLEHVAENGKDELVGFYYTKLFDACSSCHKEHAKHKFINFNEVNEKGRHEH
jgi:hypothetical protein